MALNENVQVPGPFDDGVRVPDHRRLVPRVDDGDLGGPSGPPDRVGDLVERGARPAGEEHAGPSRAKVAATAPPTDPPAP